MKNAMKKLMAFALAAIMLIGTLPFAASADDGSAETFKVYVTIKDQDDNPINGIDGQEVEAQAGDTMYHFLETLLPGWYNDYLDGDDNIVYYCGAVDGGGRPVSAGFEVPGPRRVIIKLTAKAPAGGSDEGGKNEQVQEPTVEYINLRVNLDSADNTVYTEQVFPDNKESATIENLLKYYYSDYDADWQEDYDFSHAWSSVNQKNVGYYDEVYVGDTVSIRLNAEEVISDSNSNSNSNSNGNGTGNNVNDYFGDEALSPVWLYIYTNDNLNHPTKMINITNYTITDDTITKKEVMTVIDDYYKASNSNNGIIWKGMYMEYDDSNTSSLDIYQWVYGNIGDAVYGVNEARTKGTVIIMARVTGVTTVSSAAADNSNPKTGDQIFAPVAIMAVSACALAAVAFYLNKKRAM